MHSLVLITFMLMEICLAMDCMLLPIFQRRDLCRLLINKRWSMQPLPIRQVRLLSVTVMVILPQAQ